MERRLKSRHDIPMKAILSFSDNSSQECKTLNISGDGAFLLPAEFGSVDARLILDTGATRTLLTETFAYRADIQPDYGAMIRAVTANGAVLQPTAVVEELVVAGRVVNDLRVVICETCPDLPADGLLGLDVQKALEVQLDLVGERVRFGDCRE